MMKFSYKKNVREPFFLLCLVAALTMGACTAYTIRMQTVVHLGKPQVAQNFRSIEDEKKYWKEQMEALGPEQAYTQFKARYAEDNINDAHAHAHIFGEILFEKEGLKGATVCDDTFRYGCFHSFFSRAIITYGLLVVKDLHQVCVDKNNFVFCPHGLGHGLLWYLGRDHLVDALDQCAKLSSIKQDVDSCTVGAFMEYNFSVIDDPSLATFRTPENGNLQQPCDSVPAQYQKMCYFEQTRWWDHLFEYDPEKIGTLCGDVKDDSLRRTCFFGFGQKVVGPHNFDTQWAISECERMPNKEAAVLCRDGAAWAFSILPAPNIRDTYPRMCEGLTPDEKSHCLDVSRYSK